MALSDPPQHKEHVRAQQRWGSAACGTMKVTALMSESRWHILWCLVKKRQLGGQLECGQGFMNRLCLISERKYAQTALCRPEHDHDRSRCVWGNEAARPSHHAISLSVSPPLALVLFSHLPSNQRFVFFAHSHLRVDGGSVFQARSHFPPNSL